MRLGIDIRCLQDKFRTGVGEYVWQVLRRLAAQGDLSLLGFASATPKIDLPPGLEKHMKVYQSRLPNKLMNFKFWLRQGLAMDKILKLNADNPEVMWLPNLGFSYVSDATPTLLTVHDMSFLHYPHFFPRKGNLWYFPVVKASLRRGLPAKSLIAAVSRHTADDLAFFYPRLAGRIRVVPAGLDEAYFEPVSLEQRLVVQKKYRLPASYLLALGTVEPRKNYTLLLRAYDMLCESEPNFPHDLVIAGVWGWRYAKIKKLHGRLTASSRVHFLGYVDQADKPAIYAQSQLFLYPSLYEGIGLPVLEAMAAGKAIVASHSSSLPEIIGQAGLLISPWRPELWAQAISWLSSDESARNELAQQAQVQARRYSWAKTAEAYRTLFEELLC